MLFPTAYAHFLEVSSVPQLAQSFRERSLGRAWAVGHLPAWSGPGFRVWAFRQLRVSVSGVFIAASPNLALRRPNWVAEGRERGFRRQATVHQARPGADSVTVDGTLVLSQHLLHEHTQLTLWGCVGD